MMAGPHVSDLSRLTDTCILNYIDSFGPDSERENRRKEIGSILIRLYDYQSLLPLPLDLLKLRIAINFICMILSASYSGFKEARRRFAKLTGTCEYRDFFADLLLSLLLLCDRFIITTPKKHIERAILRLTCSECYKMSAIPQGAFAALKIRKNQDLPKVLNIQAEEDRQDNKSGAFNLQEGRELSAPHYSSKLMNSIWGLYNRYSVHNFKQIHGNEESKVISAGACWDALAVKSGGNSAAVSSSGRDLCGSGPAHIMAQQHRAGH